MALNLAPAKRIGGRRRAMPLRCCGLFYRDIGLRRAHATPSYGASLPLPFPLRAAFSLALPDLRLGLHTPRGAGGCAIWRDHELFGPARARPDPRTVLQRTGIES